jgi:hypothetical protein
VPGRSRKIVNFSIQLLAPGEIGGDRTPKINSF